MLLHAAECALVVVDMQERLLPVLADPDRLIQRVYLLGKGARRLQVPILASEQYPKGLGRTIAALADLIPDDARVEKMAFSAAREEAFTTRLRDFDRRRLIVCGAEAHVCVLQTAIGLQTAGFAVMIAADAVESRRESDRQAALRRMEQAGLEIATSEMVVFEWLERAGTDAFRDLIPLIKAD